LIDELFGQDETTTLHERFLLAVGAVFGIVMGSFTIYLMYLISYVPKYFKPAYTI